ncbi:Protein of unknown function [Bacillus toyonensis]|nr:Protein of unknown function [Bacillus toyonensis]
MSKIICKGGSEEEK